MGSENTYHAFDVFQRLQVIVQSDSELAHQLDRLFVHEEIVEINLRNFELERKSSQRWIVGVLHAVTQRYR
jgi:hypothetical protein